MPNRNYIGITVVVVCLLFDAFIVEHQKRAYANSIISCFPEGKKDPIKDMGRKKHEPVYRATDSVKEK